MSDALATYLHDHIAGSRLVIEMLEEVQEVYPQQPLGELAAELLPQIREDRDVAETIAARVGNTSFQPIKDSAAWLIEKATRWKLQRGSSNDLGSIEMLEILALGILGKRSLWSALAEIADGDDRFGDIDLPRLMQRAQQQYERVEAQRLQTARALFGSRTQPA